MATAEALMGLGEPAELAKRTGTTIVNVTTSAATQNSAGGLLRGAGNKIVLANVNGVNGAVTLPADADLGDVIEIYNTSGANAGLVFPQTGGTLNQLVADDATSSFAANASICAVKVSATSWRVSFSAPIVT
jgi:hypothetical protein